MGLPAIAVSQQSTKGEMDFRFGRHFDFDAVAGFVARMVAGLDRHPISPGTLLNINCPARKSPELTGAAITRLGKRIYSDRLELIEDADGGRRRRFHIYGDDPSYHHEEGTDFAAIDAGMISVTPLHFDLTDTRSIEELSDWDLSELIGAADSA